MARSMAARASSSSTPASSKSTRPGWTTATHSSGLPLPEPMRVSAGFWVTGLSGKTRIHTLPPRLTWRVMAIRAASIWRAVSQPGSVAWIPKSPKATEVPPLAAPVRRPRCVLRCLTFLGINMSVGLPAEVRRLVVFVVLALHLLVAVQLALQLVGLGRLRQQVGHRLLGLLLGRGLSACGACGAFDVSDVLDVLSAFGALEVLNRELIDLGDHLNRQLIDFALVARAVIVGALGREAFGPPAAAAGGDEAARPALARRLSDGHGGFTCDLVLDGDLVGQNVALVDPHLHADAAGRGAGFAEAVVDVGPQRVQGDAALAVLLLARHLGTTEAARALDLDALGAGLLHGLDGPLHGPAEGHPAHQLVADALGDEGSVELRLLDLLDVQLNPVLQPGDLLELLLEPVGLGAAAADDDTGARRVDVDA